MISTFKETLYVEVYDHENAKAPSQLDMFCNYCGRELATFRDLADCWTDHRAKDIKLIFLHI